MSRKKTERLEQILSSLKKFDYLTADQIRRLHDLKSDSNTYRVISQIKPHVNYFKDGGVNVYHLNKNGRDHVLCSKKRHKLTTAQHYIIRNEVYMYLKRPKNWRNEVKITQKTDQGTTTVIADAHFKTNRDYLIEVDQTQKMTKNRQKIEKYKRLVQNGAFKSTPGLIWATKTERRRNTLQELCKGLDAFVLLENEIY